MYSKRDWKTKTSAELISTRKAKGLMYRSFNKKLYERNSQICGCDSINNLLFSMSFDCQGEDNS